METKDKNVMKLLKDLKNACEKEYCNCSYEFVWGRILNKRRLVKSLREYERTHLFEESKSLNHFYLDNKGGYFQLCWQAGSYEVTQEGEILGTYTLDTINKFCEMLEAKIFIEEMVKL